jgi:hypothetical protein
MKASFDPCITRVGFGAWAIDGSGWSFGWGSEADADSIAAIRHALDVERSPRGTLPTFAPRRIGLVWCSPSQVHFLPESVSQATMPASVMAIGRTGARHGPQLSAALAA